MTEETNVAPVEEVKEDVVDTEVVTVDDGKEKDLVDYTYTDKDGNEKTVKVPRELLEKKKMYDELRQNKKLTERINEISNKYCKVYGRHAFDNVHRYLKETGMSLDELRQEIADKKCSLSGMCRRLVKEMPDADLREVLGWYRPVSEIVADLHQEDSATKSE